MWYIGQKVVCIGLFGSTSIDCINSPDTIIGKTYTINDIGYEEDGILFLGFKEMPQDDCFLSSNFRPLLTDSIRFAEETLHKISTHIEIEIEQFILN